MPLNPELRLRVPKWKWKGPKQRTVSNGQVSSSTVGPSLCPQVIAATGCQSPYPSIKHLLTRAWAWRVTLHVLSPLAHKDVVSRTFISTKTRCGRGPPRRGRVSPECRGERLVGWLGEGREEEVRSLLGV